MSDLTGRTALVTGAGSGIGRAIAVRLAADGANVCVADIDGPAAESVAADITAAGHSAIAVTCDVGDRASIRGAIATTVDRFGRLDVLFNNAGISSMVPLLEITEELWTETMRVNGLGVLMGMQEAAKQMQAQGGGGKIINTASTGGKDGYPYFAHYGASKAAVILLTQAAARAFAPDGITVNAFCPGVVRTPMWDRLGGEAMELGEFEQAGDAITEYGKLTLGGEAASPEDMANLASFLASPESDQIRGQAINVDGGMVMH